MFPYARSFDIVRASKEAKVWSRLEELQVKTFLILYHQFSHSFLLCFPLHIMSYLQIVVFVLLASTTCSADSVTQPQDHQTNQKQLSSQHQHSSRHGKPSSKSDLATSESKNNERNSAESNYENSLLQSAKITSGSNVPGLIPQSLFQDVIDQARARTLSSLNGRLDPTTGIFTHGSPNSALLSSPHGASSNFYQPLFTQRQQQQVN